MAAACQKLIQGETDLAFTTDAPNSQQIQAEVILKEPMVLICAAKSDYPETIELCDLPIAHEVYVEWDRGFSDWHRNVWGADAVPQIRLEIMSQLQMFAAKKDNWAVPLSVADGLCAAGIRRLAPAVPLPEREIYALRKRGTGIESAQIFLNIARQLWHTPNV